MPIIPAIIEQHAENAAFNWLLRDSAVSEPHYNFADLAHLDDQVDANIDGLRIAGDAGWEICKGAMGIKEPGEIFTAGVIAFGSKNNGRMDEMLAAVELDEELARALVSALGWLDFNIVALPAGQLAGSDMAFLKHIGLSAFCVHREDPGAAMLDCLEAEEPKVRARALKAVGELGKLDLLNIVRNHFSEDNIKCLYYAAWSAALLGDRSTVGTLQQIAGSGSSYASLACGLAVLLMQTEEAFHWLRELSDEPASQRLTVNGYGLIGDPVSIPLLLDYSSVPELARLAGEAISTITGVDLAYEDLDTDAPGGFEVGPTEDPQDEDVEMDPDEDLPWPDSELVQQWWHENKSRFKAGTRYLAGLPITEENCRHVLIHGYQRQRMAAALELALMHPGQPLFETRAPGFRQQRLLGLRK